MFCVLEQAIWYLNFYEAAIKLPCVFDNTFYLFMYAA